MKPEFDQTTQSIERNSPSSDPIGISQDTRREIELATIRGIPAGEAVAAYAHRLHVDEAISVTREFVCEGSDWMLALLEVSRKFNDKKAFGLACMRAGFSPICLALSLVQKSGNQNGKPFELKRDIHSLAEMFGVDAWVADLLDLKYPDGPTLPMDKILERGVTAPLLYLPCNSICNNQENMSLSWPVEVLGDLEMEDCRKVKLDGLTWVAGNFHISSSENLEFPNLTRVDGRSYKSTSKNINAPGLKGRMF
jgi:hypothetical protein